MAVDIMLSVRRVRPVAHRRAEAVRNRLPALPRHGIRLVPPPVRQAEVPVRQAEVPVRQAEAAAVDGGEKCP